MPPNRHIQHDAGPQSIHDETNEQYEPTAWQLAEVSLHNAFINLFGTTNRSECQSGEFYGCYLNTDPRVTAGALFGSDANTNGLFVILPLCAMTPVISIN